MSAYYNEIEPFAAQWLRNLIAENLIAPGEVDERSIRDVKPVDLRGFVQCHFFAGIGVWSHALRCAGCPDDRAIWTGSCPCQPFSVAGSQRGTADERHLWPEFFRLIRECRPATVIGEQVAGPAALAWLDVVSADLEGAGYAVGAADLCAAGVGAPHIRQRLYWVAYRNGSRCGARRSSEEGLRLWKTREQPTGLCVASWMAHAGQSENGEHEWAQGSTKQSGDGKNNRILGGDGTRVRPRDGGGAVDGLEHSTSEQVGVPGFTREPRSSGGGMAYANGGQPCDGELQRGRGHLQQPETPLAGFWAAAQWLPCTDGKARPVEPGTFPLAHGVAGRVGRLRSYGNALCAPVAQAFVEAVMECCP